MPFMILLWLLYPRPEPELERLFLDPDLYVLIEAGDFEMGSADSPDEQPVRQVTISQSFYLAKHEVTQDQWRAVMGRNPSRFKDNRRPVEMITFDDATEFIETLNRKLGGRFFRLPTEAEWEYACRAGDRSAGPLSRIAWFKQNANGRTHPVGTRQPNAWGLYDMRGNVWEWVSDWYQGSYADLPDVDPRGPAEGKHHVMRGGDWDGDESQCGCTFRGNDQHGGKGPRDVYGLRLVWIKPDR